MHYIILRALAAQVLLLMPMQNRLFVRAEESTSISTTRTSTTTTTTVLSTYWVVLTDLSGSPVTYTTTGSAPGSTIGISTVLQSTKVHSHSLQPSSQPSFPTPTDMSWQGQSLREAALNSTNYFRAAHEANPLRWNDDLATYARNHADHCEFSHSGGPHGENLARGYPSPALAIDAWAYEEDDYNYEKQKFSTDVGHFTQLVWKNTTSVGCGAADCGDDGWLFVCEYDPAGNVVGEFGENVGKPGQGVDGEPGLGAGVRSGVSGGLLVALVVVQVLGDVFMFR